MQFITKAFDECKEKDPDRTISRLFIEECDQRWMDLVLNGQKITKHDCGALIIEFKGKLYVNLYF